MVSNVYVVEDLALPGRPTRTVIDDGTGIDWLVIARAHVDVTTITLRWDSNLAGASAASGAYSDGVGVPGNRLIVRGVIENARGGAGRDSISGNELANVIYGDLGAAGPGAADTLFGDEGNDAIFGGVGNDRIDGAEDNDRLWGDAGADSISGGLGVDTIAGGAGADTLSGGADRGDTVSYLASGAAVKVTLTFGAITTGLGGDAQGDRLTGFTDFVGSAFGDVIIDGVAGEVAFGGNANRFFGAAGSDLLRLGGGNDAGYGGAGNDTLEGGQGTDVLDGGAGSDRLVGGIGADGLFGGADADRFLGEDGADRLFGGLGNDSLAGGADVDRIDGGAGNDLIVGGLGGDLVSGGAGADVFQFVAFGESGDRILDMTAADRVSFRFAGNPRLQWDDLGPLDAGGVRLVDRGADVVVQINADADPAIEFAVAFANVDALGRSLFLF